VAAEGVNGRLSLKEKYRAVVGYGQRRGHTRMASTSIGECNFVSSCDHISPIGGQVLNIRVRGSKQTHGRRLNPEHNKEERLEMAVDE
jgi:hypothetical protein